MKNVHQPLNTGVSLAVLAVLGHGLVHAGGFSLYTESSPAALGNFAAGIAAEAADASIGWYNPAGLSLLHQQELVVGSVGVFPNSKLSGSSTYYTSTFPDNLKRFAAYTQTFSGIQGAENAFVPAIHYALPFGSNTTFGLSIVSPFGLSTNWGTTSPVRYAATLSELQTINVAPEFGTKITEQLAFGAGLDVQYARVKFNSMVGIPNFLNLISEIIETPISASADDTLSYNYGTSFGVGYHLGLMGLFNDQHTRIGLNYQSRVRQTFDGYSQLSGPLASSGDIYVTPVLPYSIRVNNNLTSDPIEFPDVLTLSVYHDLNDKLALLGSVVYTGWSCFDVITLNNVAAPDIDATSGSVTPDDIVVTNPQNYQSSWRAALGANYRVNEVWMLRVGGGYDQTPTTNAYRDVRLPDADRWALSLGAHYQVKPALAIDVGYTHLFSVTNPTINNTQTLTPTTTYNVNAVGSTNANLVGAQLVWLIDKPSGVGAK